MAGVCHFDFRLTRVYYSYQEWVPEPPQFSLNETQACVLIMFTYAEVIISLDMISNQIIHLCHSIFPTATFYPYYSIVIFFVSSSIASHLPVYVQLYTSLALLPKYRARSLNGR